MNETDRECEVDNDIDIVKDARDYARRMMEGHAASLVNRLVRELLLARDVIEEARQWETIARRAEADAEAGWKWAWRFDQWFGNSATSELNDEERAEFQADLQRHEDYDPIDVLAAFRDVAGERQ